MGGRFPILFIFCSCDFAQKAGPSLRVVKKYKKLKVWKKLPCYPRETLQATKYGGGLVLERTELEQGTP